MKWRRGDEPPGIWRGRPRIGARWKTGEQTYVLVSFSNSWNHLQLDYQEEGSFRENYMVQPEGARRRRWWQRRARTSPAEPPAP